MIYIPNEHIACKPLESLAVQIQGQGKGFVTVKQKNSVLELTVVYPNIRSITQGNFQGYPYQPGEKIFVSGEDTTLEYMKRKYEIEGHTVILVPCARVLAWQPFGTDPVKLEPTK